MTDQRKRYHIYKPEETKFLLIAESQARELVAGNLSILSLPGGSISDAYNFIHNEQQYEIIILFIGGNELISGCVPSYKPPSQVAQELHSLANFLAPRTKEFFLLGISERDENQEHTKKAKDILEALAKRAPGVEPKVPWKFRSVANYISGKK